MNQELNKLVAENVMGWTKFIPERYYTVEDDGCLDVSHRRCECCERVLGEPHMSTCIHMNSKWAWRCDETHEWEIAKGSRYVVHHRDWSPSDKIENAWDVVNHMRSLWSGGDNSPGAKFVRWMDSAHLSNMVAEVAATEICLAALRTVGEEED